MNSDAAAGVSVRGDAGAELPVLPWIAVGFLVAGAVCGFFGGVVLVRAFRPEEMETRS